MIAGVLIELEAEVLDKIFSYSIPNNLLDKISVGKRVKVPFGHQIIDGFIMEIKNENNSEYKLKDIIEVIDDVPILNNELMEIGKYISKTCVCKLITAYQAMLPTAYKAKVKNEYKIKKVKYISLNKELDYINEYIENILDINEKLRHTNYPVVDKNKKLL